MPKTTNPRSNCFSTLTSSWVFDCCLATSMFRQPEIARWGSWDVKRLCFKFGQKLLLPTWQILSGKNFRLILRHPSCHFGRNKARNKGPHSWHEENFQSGMVAEAFGSLAGSGNVDKLDRNISPGRFYKHLQGYRVVKYPQFLHTFWMRSSRISKSFCLAKVLDKFCKLSTWQQLANPGHQKVDSVERFRYFRAFSKHFLQVLTAVQLHSFTFSRDSSRESFQIPQLRAMSATNFLTLSWSPEISVVNT